MGQRRTTSRMVRDARGATILGALYAEKALRARIQRSQDSHEKNRINLREFIFEAVAKGKTDFEIIKALNSHAEWKEYAGYFAKYITAAREKLKDLECYIEKQIMQAKTDDRILEKLSGIRIYKCYSEYFSTLIQKVRSDLQKEAQEKQSQGRER